MLQLTVTILSCLRLLVAQEPASQAQQLRLAIKEGKLEVVRSLVEGGASLTSKSSEYTPLHYAAEYSQLEIAKYLIGKGASVSASDYLDGTPLNIAAYRGPVGLVRLLIEAGADVESIASRERATPLQGAAGAGQDEIVRELIKAGAKVNTGNFTPLMEAAKYGHAKVVGTLLEKGANPVGGSRPALHWARNVATIRALLKGGAKVDAKDTEGQTVLHLPAAPHWGPGEDSIPTLLEAGADVSARDNQDSTPLHSAARYGLTAIVRLYLKAGALPSATDKRGNTPLSLARSSRAKDAAAVIALLEEAGAVDGLQPLHKASKTGDLEGTRKLLASGAKVNEIGPEQMTALHFAAKAGQAAICLELLKAGADPKLRNEQNLTPLHLAGNKKVAIALLDAGAVIDPDPEPQSLGETGTPTPLMFAAMGGSEDVTALLLERKARVPEGLLGWVTFSGQSNVLRLLLEKGLDANQPLHSKWSPSVLPLHVATMGGLGDTGCPKEVTPEKRLEMARMLLKAGAKADARCQSGYFFDFTPLHGAAGLGESKMIELLLEAMAPINAVGSGDYFEGVTPLHLAAKGGHLEAVRVLLKAGADVKAKTGLSATDPGKTPVDVAKTGEIRKVMEASSKQ